MTLSRSSFAKLLILMLALPGCGAARGQSAVSSSKTPTIHVISDLIEVPVLALEPPFRPAPALNRGDFVIRLDGGAPFHPSHARMEGTEAVTLSILLEADTRDSGLLSQGLQAAVQGWTPTLFEASDRLSLSVYGCQMVRPLRDEPADLVLRRDEIRQAMGLPAFKAAMEGGRSCLRISAEESLRAAIRDMAKTPDDVAKTPDDVAKTPGWKVILLIVNGEQKADPKPLEGVQRFAAAEGVTLFAIKYLHNGRFPASVYSDSEGINLLVSSLGGVMLPSSFDDLGAVAETIIDDIRRRYILSFPRPGNGSPGAHRLEIDSTAKGVRVLSSAAAAPVLDRTQCANDPDNWFCSEQRPRYGADNPERDNRER